MGYVRKGLFRVTLIILNKFMNEWFNIGYLPLEFDTSGLASSESFLIATAFLILFIAFPPTFAVFARLLGLVWPDDTEISYTEINLMLEYFYCFKVSP